MVIFLVVVISAAKATTAIATVTEGSATEATAAEVTATRVVVFISVDIEKRFEAWDSEAVMIVGIKLSLRPNLYIDGFSEGDGNCSHSGKGQRETLHLRFFIQLITRFVFI